MDFTWPVAAAVAVGTICLAIPVVILVAAWADKHIR